jgi:hypothetical protein
MTYLTRQEELVLKDVLNPEDEVYLVTIPKNQFPIFFTHIL